LGWWLAGLYILIHLTTGLLAAELAWRLQRRVRRSLEHSIHA